MPQYLVYRQELYLYVVHTFTERSQYVSDLRGEFGYYKPAMLFVRGLIFTVAIPGLVAVWIPYRMLGGRPAAAGAWGLGWILVAIGAAVYLRCLAGFLASGGTPAMFFTRSLRWLIGEEPPLLVRGGLYRFSRNPMYLGVLAVIFGQAIVFASGPVARYGVLMAIGFHLAVVLFEEPHLRAREGAEYEEYCRRVPRWLGWAG